MLQSCISAQIIVLLSLLHSIAWTVLPFFYVLIDFLNDTFTELLQNSKVFHRIEKMSEYYIY